MAKTSDGLMTELKAAGFGGYCKPNTLVGMVRDCIATLQQERAARKRAEQTSQNIK